MYEKMKSIKVLYKGERKPKKQTIQAKHNQKNENRNRTILTEIYASETFH